MEAREAWHFDTDIIPGYYMWNPTTFAAFHPIAKEQFMDSEWLATILHREMRV